MPGRHMIHQNYPLKAGRLSPYLMTHSLQMRTRRWRRICLRTIPQEAVARLVYTYNERRVGDAWIYSSRVQAVNATPSEPGEDTPQESQPERTDRTEKPALSFQGQCS